ncbi:MAG: DUF4338 domain-containing protein [Nitrospinae bacterium]|nr:DUF4338 domain-containing protein [Nitrospinota bacterium]
MRYRGKDFSDDDITKIRELINANLGISRFKLSKLVCETFEWRSPNGKLKDMGCRVAMLQMERDHLLTLPPLQIRPNQFKTEVRRNCIPPKPSSILTEKTHPLDSLKIEIVTGQPSSAIWNEYIDRYHYLGFKPLAGAQIRYFVKSQDEILALLGFDAASWKVSDRDKLIGWSPKEREAKLHLIVNNCRLLVLPWVHYKNLISYCFSKIYKRLPDDWEKVYNYRPVLLETFIEDQRFTGSAYKASNWQSIGKTKGRGKWDRNRSKSIPIKSVWIYPLAKKYRKYLSST